MLVTVVVMATVEVLAYCELKYPRNLGHTLVATTAADVRHLLTSAVITSRKIVATGAAVAAAATRRRTVKTRVLVLQNNRGTTM